MRVSGHHTLQASPEEVFDALHDPGVLVRTVPGCERLEPVGPGSFHVTVSAGVASVRGRYEGRVDLTDPDRPSGFTLRAAAAGAPGTVELTVQVRLNRANDGTRLEYDADAAVGGMVGGVGQRMLTGVGKRTAVQFFTAVDDLLAGRLPEPVPAGAAPAAAAATAAPPGAVLTAPRAGPGSADDLRVPFWIVLAGVGAGASCALAGVAVGHRVATGRRR